MHAQMNVSSAVPVNSFNAPQPAPAQSGHDETILLSECVRRIMRRNPVLEQRMTLRELASGAVSAARAPRFARYAEVTLELLLMALLDAAEGSAQRVWYTTSDTRRNKIVLMSRGGAAREQLVQNPLVRLAQHLLHRHGGDLQLLDEESRETLLLALDFGPTARA